VSGVIDAFVDDLAAYKISHVFSEGTGVTQAAPNIGSLAHRSTAGLVYKATHATRGAVAIRSLSLAHSAVVSRRQNKLGTSIHIYIYIYVCIHV